MGVNVHWINDDFSRGSGALACRRMVGAHDYLAIASVLSLIMRDAGIPVNEVTKIVTDNAFNFPNTFNRFSKTDDLEEDQSDGSDVEVKEQELDVEVIDIYLHPECTFTEDDIVDDLYLPQQERCAAHSLNLFGSSDGRSTDLN